MTIFKKAITMKTRSTGNTNKTGSKNMKPINQIQLEVSLLLVEQFNYEEMRTCLEAAMSLSKIRSLKVSKEILFKTLRADFSVLGNMMSGSNAHYSLIKKLELLTESEKNLLVLLCHQYWHGEEDIIHSIGELVNEHCQSIDSWPSGKSSDQNKISGTLDITLDFKSFVSSVCNDVNCMDICTSFSIPSSGHNSMMSVEILRQMINKLGYQVLSIIPVEDFNYNYNTVTQVNHVIDTNLPISIYFNLMADEAA
jgi:hypothetical protein